MSGTSFINYAKFFVLTVCALLVGCMKENLDDCPPGVDPDPDPGPGVENRQLLYFTVNDVLTGQDVSATEYLDEIEVYLFDGNALLVDTLDITMEDIRNGVPLDLTGRNLEGGYVSVWGNLANSIDMTPVTFGARMQNLTLSMSENILQRGFYNCPGDLFFGTTPLDFTSRAIETDTVQIKRKNGKVNIIVRGLNPPSYDPDAYYFKIGALFSGYNFAGTPQAEDRDIRELGSFDASGHFYSPEPYIFIHHPASLAYTEDYCVVVSLYQTGLSRAEDTEIIQVNRDTNGKYIEVQSGKTTNILIDLAEDGNFTVNFRLTDWNEIYQWEEW